MVKKMSLIHNITFEIYHDGPSQVISEYILNNKKGYICVLSGHGFSLSLVDKIFNNTLCNSLTNVPDGKPIALYARYKYKKRVMRIYGPDLMVSILKTLNNLKRKKIFFIGGSKKIENIIVPKINALYPNLLIVGFDSRFIDLNKPDNSLIKAINKQNPDIIFVGIGCPKQELWMYQNSNKINSLLIGVGAAFDFFAETKKQAPRWMQDNYLEWLYRLSQEPRRLFSRYFKYNLIFLIHCFIMLLRYPFNSLKRNFFK